MLNFIYLGVASCGTPDAANLDAGTPDAGPPLDPMQACIDACEGGNAQCMEPGVECAPWCEQIFRNVTPSCQDETAAEWVCVAPAMQIANDYCTFPWDECQSTLKKRLECIDEFGCTTPGWGDEGIRGCVTLLPGPNGEPGCTCTQRCAGQDYQTTCRAQGSTVTCECYRRTYDSVLDPPTHIYLLGTCGGGPLCEDSLDKSCCNQFFNIVL